jgi:hypothetical protein
MVLCIDFLPLDFQIFSSRIAPPEVVTLAYFTGAGRGVAGIKMEK